MVMSVESYQSCQPYLRVHEALLQVLRQFSARTTFPTRVVEGWNTSNSQTQLPYSKARAAASDLRLSKARFVGTGNETKERAVGICCSFVLGCKFGVVRSCADSLVASLVEAHSGF